MNNKKDLHKILTQVIKVFFPNNKFNCLGKLEWHPVTEKERKRTFLKKGTFKSQQRVRFFKTDDFEVNRKIKSVEFRQLLISDIEENGIFYCVSDYRTLGNMGQSVRYKFKILRINKQTNISDHAIQLLEEKMILIR